MNGAQIVSFWKTNEENGYLSNWFPSPFECEGHVFPTAEHYIMWMKAMFFNDATSAELILRAKSPGEAKKIGRAVKNYNEIEWESIRFFTAKQAIRCKFSKNGELRNKLMATRGTIVEASPFDLIWGAGTSADKLDAGWKGMNLLGFALMEIRDEFQRTAEGAAANKKSEL